MREPGQPACGHLQSLQVHLDVLQLPQQLQSSVLQEEVQVSAATPFTQKKKRACSECDVSARMRPITAETQLDLSATADH